MNDLIRNMLTPNPVNRININQLLTLVEKWDSYTQIPLNVLFLSYREKLNKLNNNGRRNKSSWMYLIRKQSSIQMIFLFKF